MLQKTWVVVSDAKAMHSIFIKEQDVYEEPILYVQHALLTRSHLLRTAAMIGRCV